MSNYVVIIIGIISCCLWGVAMLFDLYPPSRKNVNVSKIYINPVAFQLIKTATLLTIILFAMLVYLFAENFLYALITFMVLFPIYIYVGNYYINGYKKSVIHAIESRVLYFLNFVYSKYIMGVDVNLAVKAYADYHPNCPIALLFKENKYDINTVLSLSLPAHTFVETLALLSQITSIQQKNLITGQILNIIKDIKTRLMSDIQNRVRFVMVISVLVILPLLMMSIVVPPVLKLLNIN